MPLCHILIRFLGDPDPRSLTAASRAPKPGTENRRNQDKPVSFRATRFEGLFSFHSEKNVFKFEEKYTRFHLGRVYALKWAFFEGFGGIVSGFWPNPNDLTWCFAKKNTFWRFQEYNLELTVADFRLFILASFLELFAIRFHSKSGHFGLCDALLKKRPLLMRSQE